MTAIPIAQASPSLSSEPPAAYRIPSEMLDEIVLQVCSLYDDAVDRAPLRHICLVSRRWAEITRPEVWHSVVIVSAVHLRNLCSLLDAPLPRSLIPLTHLMHLLVCAVDFLDRSQPPWLHLVHPHLAPRIKYPTRASLDVVHDGVLENLRTIHPSLPRTIPSCFAPIRTLWLNRAAFKTRTTQLYLLNSLVHLRSLVCRGIAWKSDEPPAASLVLRSTLHTIWVDDPSEAQTDDEAGMLVWWLLPAVFGSCPRPNARTVRTREGAPALREADFRVLVGMVAALQSGRRLNRFRLKLFPVRSQSHVELRCIFASTGNAEVKVHLTFGFMKSTHTGEDAAGSIEITDVLITLREDATYSDGTWTLEDWTKFVRRTRQLPALKVIRVDFDCEERMQAFARKFDAAFQEVDEMAYFTHGEAEEGKSIARR